MKYKFLRFIRTGKKFKKEFRTELRLLIIITLGFTIAFTWRQTIFDLSQNFIHLIIKESSPLSTIFTSIFITIISLLLISITSNILKKDNN